MTAIEAWCEEADALLSDRKACQRALDAGDDPDGCYCPTPEEIAAACREIRESWTPEEEQARRRAKVGPWAVPTCRVALAERNLED